MNKDRVVGSATVIKSEVASQGAVEKNMGRL